MKLCSIFNEYFHSSYTSVQYSLSRQVPPSPYSWDCHLVLAASLRHRCVWIGRNVCVWIVEDKSRKEHLKIQMKRTGSTRKRRHHMLYPMLNRTGSRFPDRWNVSVFVQIAWPSLFPVRLFAFHTVARVGMLTPNGATFISFKGNY